MTDAATDISLDQFSADAVEFLEGQEFEQRSGEKTPFRWGEGSDNVAVLEEESREREQAGLAVAREWMQARFDAGFGWVSGPTEYGGRGLPIEFDRTYRAIEGRYQTPSTSYYGIGLGMVAPTLLTHGTDVTKDAYLRKMWRGDIVGCQMFSEPGAGSDLAGLQTRAERDGDEWLINGQKVWTSGAQYSDVGEIICRTDPDLPKHKGLTGFMVDMHTPGIEVRPLRQMTGGASFNEVFFTDVRVPDDHRLGDVNHGWTVALTTLMNERAAIGGGGAGLSGMGGVANAERLIQMLHHFGVHDDALHRQELARVYSGFQTAKYTNQRAMAKIKAGQTPGPEMSIAKMALTRNLMAVTEFAARVLGPRITANTGEWGTFSWNGMLLGIPGMRIAGGTDEVLRNIVGERVLGLPKDPDVSKTVAFRDLAVGTQSG